jgi:hypothetical protein
MGTGQKLGFLAKGLPHHRPNKLSASDRSALGFYLTCPQSGLPVPSRGCVRSRGCRIVSYVGAANGCSGRSMAPAFREHLASGNVPRTEQRWHCAWRFDGENGRESRTVLDCPVIG